MTEKTTTANKKSSKLLAFIAIVITFVLIISASDNPPSPTPTPSPSPSPTLTPEQLQAEQGKLADHYCSVRSNDDRRYLIPSFNERENRPSLDTNIAKAGRNLSASDCRKITEIMYKYPNMFPNIPAITEREYWIGMNSSELLLSAGSPDDINTSNYGGLEQEQWVYHKDSYGVSSYYIYVQNNTVTSYQDF